MNYEDEEETEEGNVTIGDGASATDKPKAGDIRFTVDFTPSYLDDQVVNRIADILSARMEPIKDKIEAAVTENIERQMSIVVEKALTDIIQPTNSLGKPTGPAISLQDRMLELAQVFLDQKVNRDGKAVDSCNSYGDKWSRAEWVANKCANDVWERKLSGIVDAEMEKLEAVIYQKAVERFASRLHKLIGDKPGDK